MAQFRTTADIVDLALTNAGETTNGNSPYEADLLNKLNRAHFTLCAGGTIALGKDQTIEIDETWPWAKAQRALILELQPKYDTGSVTLTLGSEAGTFSSAPSYSVEGWFIRIDGRPGVFQVASHSAASTAFELDAAYPDDSGAGLNFTLFKLDYELKPDYLVIDSSNNKIDFRKVDAGAIITATLTAGSYTPSALITHVAAAMTTAAAGPTITGAYDSVTKKFSLTSNGAGPSVFQLPFASGTNQAFSVHKLLGFDDMDVTGALTYAGTYILGGIARLIEPFRIHTERGGYVTSVDPEVFTRDYGTARAIENYPSAFTLIKEKEDGTLTVRFNAYPREKTRIDLDYVPVPRDLKDNSGSVPLVPRKHVDVLEDAATFYIMLLKSDDRATAYANLVVGKLKAMIAQHRGSLLRAGDHYGQAIPRRDMLRDKRRKLFTREPY